MVTAKGNHFFAMINRMRYITRWSLMRNTEQENIQEHSMQVAAIAHALAVIRKLHYSEGRIVPEPERVAMLGLYHDASEILTGDMPTPIKYYSPEIKTAYKAVEAEANKRLVSMLPDEMKEIYKSILEPDRSDPETDEAMKMVKAADRLCAYIKCVQEEQSGNKEFTQAKSAILQTIRDIDMPEFDWFCDKFMPSFTMTLDQMQ